MNNYGLHVNANNNAQHLYSIKYYYKKYKCSAFQIFLSGSALKVARITKQNKQYLEEIKQYITKHKISLIVHSPYTFNIAQPLRTPNNKPTDDWWINAIVREYGIANNMNIKYTVLHCGKLKGINDMFKENTETQNIKLGIQTMKECLTLVSDIIHKKYPIHTTCILLENLAGQKNELLYNFPDLLQFYKNLDNKQKDVIKLCLDTCHLFASGYELSKSKDVDDLFELIDKEVGISTIKVIHLNDSKYECGSRLDRHASLGEGKINKSCIKRFIKLAKKYNIIMILETPHDRQDSDIELIRST